MASRDLWAVKFRNLLRNRQRELRHQISLTRDYTFSSRQCSILCQSEQVQSSGMSFQKLRQMENCLVSLFQDSGLIQEPLSAMKTRWQSGTILFRDSKAIRRFKRRYE